MANVEQHLAEDDDRDPLKSKIHASNLRAGDSTEESSPGPSASENNSNIKRFTSRPEVEIVKALTFPFEDSQRPKISRSMSLTTLFNPKWKRTLDSFFFPDGHSFPGSAHPQMSTKELAKSSIHRSYSAPAISKDGCICLHGNIVHLIPTSPQKGKEIAMTLSSSPTYDSDKKAEGDKQISDEEAVCRICLIELTSGPKTIKTDCNCRGELALAHQECAVKWFSIKGNRICDVCKKEVRNLPARLHNAYSLQGSGIEPAEVTRYRVWQDISIIVIISMLAYFGYLEQLLAGKMGSGSLAISLPFSCILSLLASIAAAAMVWKQYVWIYATAQFALLMAFSQIFYSALHMEPFLAVLLATFFGFGATMILTSMLVQVLRRTRRWPPDQPTETIDSQNHQDIEMGASQALQQG